MTIEAPAILGRSVVLSPGAPVPSGWEGAPRFSIDAAILDDENSLRRLVDEMHRHWVARDPMVIELGVDDGALRSDRREPAPAWELPGDFTFLGDRLHFLCWANSYDFRSGRPVWWWAHKAEAIGAECGGEADVVLEDGRPAWIDGGPRGPVAIAGAVVHSESVTAGRLTVIGRGAVGGDGDLAADQLDAVGHVGGGARIIAPAGSGKTRTLTARILHLLDDRGVEPELICALAYNNRAAGEMRDRIGSRPGLRIRTIHSLGWEILRAARGDLALLDEREQRRLLDAMIEAPRRPNVDVVGPYIEALGEVRIALRPPEDVEAFRDDVPGFTAVYHAYRDRLARRGRADFDEQIFGAVEALLRDPDLRGRWQRRCRHVVVDEFQDLTPAYLMLIRLVAAPELTVFGVGDDDQVIYGYLGADPGFLIDYEGLFPGAASHALELNYRCPPRVVAAAATLLGYNRRRVEKVIVAASDTEEPDSLVVDLVASDQMGPACADRVAGWLEATDPDRMAVLCRVNSALLPAHLALHEMGVPFRSPLGLPVLERTVLAAALAWMRIALGPDRISRSDLMRVVRRPARGLTRLMADLAGNRRHFSLDEVIDLGSGLDGKRADRWCRLGDDLRRAVRAASSGDTGGLLDAIIDEVGLDGAAAALDAGRRRADRSAQSDDLVALRRAAVLHPDPAGFEAWLRDGLGREPGSAGVELSTVHRVKGMEWDRVIIFAADRGLMPHDLAEDIEEERRVFHVAMTRGRRQVVFLADRERPSRFLDEMTGAASRPRPAATAEGEAPAAGLEVGIGDRVRLFGGHSGVVSGFEDAGALVAVGDATLLVEWGEPVATPGGSGPLIPPRPEPRIDGAIEARLKEWRRETAAAAGVPAYVVLHDRTIAAIAAVRPRTERALIEVPGIGPAKLEDYGDEILAICAD